METIHIKLIGEEPAVWRDEEGNLHCVDIHNIEHIFSGMYPTAITFDGLEQDNSESISFVGNNKEWKTSK